MELNRTVQGAPMLPVRVLTPERVARLAAANAAARKLRVVGLRVLDEDLFPDDDGAAILLVDLNGWPLGALRDMCEASTWHAHMGTLTAQFDGVRLVVARGNGLDMEVTP